MSTEQPFLFDRVNPEPAAAPQPSQPSPSGIRWVPGCEVPVAHSASPTARHASATGAQQAARSRARLRQRYIALLRTDGPLSDHEAAERLGVGLSSINSTRSQLGVQVVEAPSTRCQVVRWPSGGTTRRTRWMLALANEGATTPCGS